MQYREPPLLLANDGKGVFTNMADTAGVAFAAPYLGRGLAIGDFDNNGAIDAAFINLNSRPVLLRNTAAAGNHWLGIRLRGTQSNRDAIGARVSLRQGSKKLTRWVTGGGSFLPSHDLRIVFGLGQDTADPEIDIQWPNGAVQKVIGLARDRYHQITEPTKEVARIAISPGNSGQL